MKLTLNAALGVLNYLVFADSLSIAGFFTPEMAG